MTGSYAVRPFRAFMTGDRPPPPREPVPPPPEPPPDTVGPLVAGEPPQRHERRMTGGRAVALVFAVIAGIGSLAVLAAGISALVVDRIQRDSDGFLTTGSVRLESGEYAIVGPALDIDTDAPDWVQAEDVLGDVQLRFDAGDRDVFAGLARESDAAEYLAGLGYDEVSRIDGDTADYSAHDGGAPDTIPAEQQFWADSVSGSGDQTLTFAPRDGRWVVVVMNADGSQGVDVTARVAAELPLLPWVAVALIVIGVFGAGITILLFWLALRRDRQLV